MKLLEVCDVTKRFGGLLALHQVHCTIEKGQITGLIGPNGAGKTTLFNLIAGEFTPDQGSIFLQGEPMH
jgi:branched-chain amino acid transport system ATP-binding protein